ncbi:DinB family protein [Paenibacillus flagellatus]|uniref:DinB family protein n=1 Tax=Paenibacillus flagellatus TaxID=2211139 RepID=A0A2V5K7G4_9BACL|nr:DinB family protein [Paenibacillus flagellatus]PYI53934.1 DinB family protein [Paenibacillus flagellatus]
MTDNELVLHGWDTCYDKEDWFPPLAQALDGVTAEQASWRPAGEAANTIWETVLHLLFYKERLLKRLTGEETSYPSGLTNDDTFAGATGDEAGWRDTLDRLKRVHLAIRERIASWEEGDFERLIPKKPAGLWAFSLITHDAYHIGQIVQTRKLQGSWPSKRSFE